MRVRSAFGSRWTLTPPWFFAIFALLTLAYLTLVFPGELNHLTQAQLLELVKIRPQTALDRAYLPLDSAGYLAAGHESWGNLFKDATAVHGLSFGLFSNISVIALGKLALLVTPAHPLGFVTLVNLLLFAGALVQGRAICRLLDIRFDRFLPLMLVNLLVFFSLFTLNKEAPGLFIVTATVRYAMEERRGPVVALAVLALYTRNVLFGFCVLALLRSLLRRIPVWSILVIASLAWPLVLLATHDEPFGSEFGTLDNLTQYFHQQLQSVMTVAFKISKFPFGYILGWVIVIGVDVASPAFNVKYYRAHLDHLNLANAALQVSSICFVVLLLRALWIGRQRVLEVEPFFWLFVYTVLTGVYPFSQHRYLLPAYPLVVLGYLAVTKERESAYAGRRLWPGNRTRATVLPTSP